MYIYIYTQMDISKTSELPEFCLSAMAESDWPGNYLPSACPGCVIVGGLANVGALISRIGF